MKSALLGLAALAVASVAGTAFAGSVSKVIDGDDLCLCGDSSFVHSFAGRSKKCGRKCVHIRLCGIDAREMGQPGGREAQQKLAALTAGKTVRCTAVDDGTVCDGRSKRWNGKRLVAQCFIGDRDIAQDMVDGGHACDWLKFSGGHYSQNGVDKACPPGHRKRGGARKKRP